MAVVEFDTGARFHAACDHAGVSARRPEVHDGGVDPARRRRRCQVRPAVAGAAGAHHVREGRTGLGEAVVGAVTAPAETWSHHRRRHAQERHAVSRLSAP